MSKDPRAIATELIRSTAGDIDTLAISEYLGDQDVDDPGDQLTNDIADLISQATVSVGWPATEASSPTDGVDLAAEVRRLRTELAGCQRHLDEERVTVGQLRQDLREADENAGFLQQHLANIRNGDA